MVLMIKVNLHAVEHNRENNLGLFLGQKYVQCTFSWIMHSIGKSLQPCKLDDPLFVTAKFGC